MTVGIVVCVEDGVMLLADDRRSNPFAPGMPRIDRVEKITRLSDNLAVITLGIELATGMALRTVPSGISSSWQHSDIVTELDRSLQGGWTWLKANMAPDVDRQAPAMRAGFLFGGYTDDAPCFGGGILYLPDSHDPPVILTKALQYVVLGGEDTDAQGLFGSLSAQYIPQFGTDGGLMKAGTQTIKRAAAANSTVGSNVSYARISRTNGYSFGWCGTNIQAERLCQGPKD